MHPRRPWRLQLEIPMAMMVNEPFGSSPLVTVEHLLVGHWVSYTQEAANGQTLLQRCLRNAPMNIKLMSQLKLAPLSTHFNRCLRLCKHYVYIYIFTLKSTMPYNVTAMPQACWMKESFVPFAMLSHPASPAKKMPEKIWTMWRHASADQRLVVDKRATTKQYLS